MGVHVKVNEYLILSECIEAGVAYGLRRYDKYATVALTSDQHIHLAEHLEREVLNAICEKFTFPVDTTPETV